MRKYFLSLVSISFFISCRDKPVNNEGLTEKEVTDFITHYDNLWARRDTSGMKEAMAENYIYFTSVGSTTDGIRIISWFTPADKYKVDNALRTEINVIINGNTAVVSSRWVGSGSFDGEKFNDDQRCSLTIQKVNDRLKLISEHCTQIVNSH